MSEAGPEPIAIIGIGCRFPGAAGAEAFWRLLADGREAVGEIPPARWSRDALYHDDPASAPGTIRTRLGGYLDGIEQFDATFFGISPREAMAIDPQQRLLLETSWEAMEDAGLVTAALGGEKVGVFVGIAAYDYAEIQHAYENRHLIGPHTNTGLALSIAANRISYIFDFRGPSVAVDTACSSSLVAVHLACRSLIEGESCLALVGGVNAILKPEGTIGFSRASMLAPDGRCKTFDARANGYTRGEGAGVVVLKPLADARRDGDHVYAVIRGSAVNQDGRTKGMSVPSGEAQEAALRTAFSAAGVTPAHVQYVEAHGTGTPVGDPIEARALGAVLGEGRLEGDYCRIGSVKTNIGHLEAAAGIAGLIKAALAIERRVIPATLNFERVNPEIPLDALKLRVVAAAEPWPDNGHPARAGVNSFGFGGTNAHVLIEEPPPSSPAAAKLAAQPSRALILPVSARAPEALRASIADVAAGLERGGDAEVPGLCYWASVRRGHHAHRAAAVGRSAADLAERLRNLSSPSAQGEASKVRSTPQIVFVYSGMGAQWWAMGRQLLEAEPVFRDTIEQCDALFARRAGWSLLRELAADQEASRMSRTEVSQPCNFALQLALTNLWRLWGVAPAAIVGHSAGEVAAGHVSGILSLEDAVEVVYHRSRLQQKTAGRGKMAAVGLTKAEALRRIEAYDGRVSVAAVNAPEAVTLSGDDEALHALVSACEKDGVFARFLRVDVPYHSHHMDAIEDELHEALAALGPGRARIPLYSTVTGDLVDGPSFDAAYWWRNVRQPVEFAGAVAKIVEAGGDTFVEISPHPVLSSAVTDGLTALARPGTVVPSLRREADDRLLLLRSLADLYMRGVDIDWSGVYPEAQPFARLPSYPWQRQSYWHEAGRSKSARLTEIAHPLLGLRRSSPRPEWATLLDARVRNYLGDHRFDGSLVFPGAGYVEMALAVAREELGGTAFVVEDVAFERALVLPEAEPVQAVTSYDPELGEVVIEASADGTAWERHARCNIRALRNTGEVRDVAELRAACARALVLPYDIFADAGLVYGPSFQRIEQRWQGRAEGVARIAGVEAGHDSGRYLLHPTLLDACFQLLVGTIATGDEPFEAYLPMGIDKLMLHVPPGTRGPLWAHARMTERRGPHIAGDLVLMDESGRRLVEIRRLVCHALRQGRTTTPALADALYGFRWRVDDVAHLRIPDAMLLRPREIAERVRAKLPDIVDGGERAVYYSQVEPALDEACGLIAAGALARLGAAFVAGETIEVERLSRGAGVQGHKSRLVRRLMTMLENGGICRRSGGDWRVCETVEPPAVARILDPLARRFRLYAPEIELLRRCAERLPEVLRGEVEPLELIFPEGSLALAERIYRDSRSFGIYNAVAREAVRAVVDALPETSTLRILEIGAGVGSLTAEVLHLLPEERTQYLFTDVSGNFTQKAAQQFGRYRFVEFRPFDLQRPAEEQGLPASGFHLVLASDVMHATQDLCESLAHIGELLAPGGLLIATELTKPPFWFDLVFGLLPGWWAFADGETRPDHACVSGAVWRDLLQRSGFPEVELLSEGRDSGDTIHSVIVARRAPAAASQPAVARTERGTWLVLRDRAGVGAELGDALRRLGQRVVLADRAATFEHVGSNHFAVSVRSRDDMRQLLDAVGAKCPDLRGVIHLCGLDHVLDEQGTAVAAVDAAQEIAAGLLNVMQALVERGERETLRLLAVTAGAEPVVGSDKVDPVQAALWGLGRVFLNEHPEIPFSIVDLSARPEAEELSLLAADCVSGGKESEVALRGGSRFVHRLEAMQFGHLVEGRERPLRDGETFQLDYARTGVLDGLVLRAGAASAPGPGQVEIAVAAAGLNFRDVMKVLGIYPTEGGARLSLGDECAGTVVAVGDGVEDLAPGDRVAAIASAFASRVTVDRRLVARLPDHVSFAEGATIPISFLTADYALDRLAHLAPRERILIHAAAGGVGQAACQIAALRQAVIFATAGSEEKREFLHSLGIDHVMDSRSLEFADRVLEITHEEGVDVVLNSLSGRAIPKSLALLRSYGRFLEIGKTDIYRDSRLGLRPFRRNLSYFAIDLDAVFNQQIELAGQLLDAVMRKVACGDYKPLRHKVFAISEAERAFRHMAQAKHIGKIVLSMEAPRVKLMPRKFAALPFRQDGTYVITGGLGGIGRALVPWMIGRGARHLVLMGRSGAIRPELALELEAARTRGAEVAVVKCDVADEAALAATLVAIRKKGPPIRGILHGAMVLDDGLIPQLDAERMARVLRPKIGGAWALHRQTLEDPLDLFVLFSSFAAVVGNIGQANYAAANTFLDALAHYRRAAGLPGLAVDWGAISARGYVAEHAEIEQHFRRQGLTPFPPEQAFAMLEALLREGAGQISVVDLDWAAWGRHAPGVASSPRFQYVLKEQKSQDGGGVGSGLVLERLKAASSGERRQLMLEVMQERIAAVLGLSADAVDVNQSPSDLGLDSLMAVELSCAIEDHLGFKAGTLELIQAPSLAALAERFVERVAL
jgi:acyl transferase domain-containing protein/NADPH:quinone reductase-like Zn-dependent oxidoreductase/acyl carrier protein/NADP-dependent 3-hydroxy acid dehydrogenase YdfG